MVNIAKNTVLPLSTLPRKQEHENNSKISKISILYIRKIQVCFPLSKILPFNQIYIAFKYFSLAKKFTV
jgi:hypothetical protein